jgi:hypothetical protein
MLCERSELMADDSFKASLTEIYVHVAELLSSTDSSKADRLRRDALTTLSSLSKANQFYDNFKVRALIGLKEFAAARDLLLSHQNTPGELWRNVWLAAVYDGL